MYRSVLAVLVAVAATAQTPPGSAISRFEVASIKPNSGASRTVFIAAPSPGTFRAENVWLRFLIQIAWDVRNYQDETGLEGSFDVHMEWTADQSTPGFYAPGLGPSAPPVGDDSASIFTVIREKPGLALEAKKGPVTVLVIDAAERPSAN